MTTTTIPDPHGAPADRIIVSYQTTTEYRTHWIDSAGRRYEQRYPFRSGLTPVVNLDEVRGWLDLSTTGSDVRLRSLPRHDGRTFYVARFLLDDVQQSERDRLAPLIAKELTDDVPRYAQAPDVDWRTPFVESRERWPLPVLTGYPVELRNLTPHAVTIGEVTIQPSGTIARATEESTPAGELCCHIGPAYGSVMTYVPITTTRYTGLVDLPEPAPGVYLIVSMVIPPVVRSRGRWTGDLLTPGQQVRDAAGRVIGCRSLDRVTP